MGAEFSLIRALISNWHTERIMGSYEKPFAGRGGGGGRLILVRNSSKFKYCSLFSKYSVQNKKLKSKKKKKRKKKNMLHYETQSEGI